MIDISSPTRRGAILASLAGAFALVIASPAGATGRYGDQTGDSRSAPDIERVTVTSDAAGTIQFEIRFSGASLRAEGLTYLFLDTDLNAATGLQDAGGADYAFVHDRAQHMYDFVRWNGSEWEGGIPYSTVHVFSTEPSLRIVVNRSELGNTDGFNFLAATRTGAADEGERDLAPDNGMWNYSLAAQGPDIRKVVVGGKPAAPKAGRAFTVAVTGLQLPPAATFAAGLPVPESYVCRATIAGRAIRGFGDSGCTWKLPKTARGRVLVVTVTVTFEGVSKSVRSTYRVT